MGSLAGQAGIVTGAGRGIGRAIAIALAEQGADLVVNDVSADGGIEETAQQCREHGTKCVVEVGDVGDPSAVQQMVDRAQQEFGRIDVAVANAAYSKREAFLHADLDEFEKTIRVTMWGPFYLTRQVSQAMVAADRRGSIVVISSPHAHRAIPGSMAYNMAKAAIDQMARTAATELSRQGIRVNIIHPGWVDTPGERNYFSEEKIERLGSQLPLGRLARPDEIARGVTFLCDPASEYITGTTICIDGGILLPFQEMHRIEEQHPQ